MAKSIVLGAVILTLALFSPCMAMQANQASGVPQTNKSVKTAQPPSSTPNVQSAAADQQVVNVVVDRIEGGTIYSKDGRQFDTGSAKVVDNSGSHPGAKTKVAELFYKNGSLVSVILK